VTTYSTYMIVIVCFCKIYGTGTSFFDCPTRLHRTLRRKYRTRMPYICLYIALCDSEALPMPNHSDFPLRDVDAAAFTVLASLLYELQMVNKAAFAALRP
jgi:hypothetical protein